MGLRRLITCLEMWLRPLVFISSLRIFCLHNHDLWISRGGLAVKALAALPADPSWTPVLLPAPDDLMPSSRLFRSCIHVTLVLSHPYAGTHV